MFHGPSMCQARDSRYIQTSVTGHGNVMGKGWCVLFVFGLSFPGPCHVLVHPCHILPAFALSDWSSGKRDTSEGHQ